jgi:membrane protease YdiL (CAAX protease family)
MYVVNIFALSILMTGLYIRSGGDLLLMILVHVMANWCPVSFNAEVTAEVVLAAMVLGCGCLRPQTLQVEGSRLKTSS